MPGTMKMYKMKKKSPLKGGQAKLDANKASSDDDNSYDLDYWGAYGKFWNDPSSDSQDEYTLWYNNEQLYASVFASAGGDVSSASSGTTSQQVNPIEVGAALLDTDYTSALGSDNLIVVGGPCVNNVAMSLMGNPADCTEGFAEGKAKVKLFAHDSGKVSMLVAGYTYIDTQAASRAIASGEIGSVSGMEAEISVTSVSNYAVGTPSAE